MKKLILLVIILFFSTSIANAQNKGKSTGFELPRFVSLKTNDSNLRVGASKDFPIKLKYIIKNLPLEIIDEHENWRKVVDIDNNEGWIHKRLIIGKRFGIIKTFYEQPAQILNKPQGTTIGKIGNRNIVRINKCLKKWCYISFKKNKGWINKINLWGVYENEKFNLPFYHFIIEKFWKLI